MREKKGGRDLKNEGSYRVLQNKNIIDRQVLHYAVVVKPLFYGSTN